MLARHCRSWKKTTMLFVGRSTTFVQWTPDRMSVEFIVIGGLFFFCSRLAESGRGSRVGKRIKKMLGWSTCSPCVEERLPSVLFVLMSHAIEVCCWLAGLTLTCVEIHSLTINKEKKKRDYSLLPSKIRQLTTTHPPGNKFRRWASVLCFLPCLCTKEKKKRAQKNYQTYSRSFFRSFIHIRNRWWGDQHNTLLIVKQKDEKKKRRTK